MQSKSVIEIPTLHFNLSAVVLQGTSEKHMCAKSPCKSNRLFLLDVKTVLFSLILFNVYADFILALKILYYSCEMIGTKYNFNYGVSPVTKLDPL